MSLYLCDRCSGSIAEWPHTLIRIAPVPGGSPTIWHLCKSCDLAVHHHIRSAKPSKWAPRATGGDAA